MQSNGAAHGRPNPPRNAEPLLREISEVIAERGLHEIADRAGVGAGTLEKWRYGISNDALLTRLKAAGEAVGYELVWRRIGDAG